MFELLYHLDRVFGALNLTGSAHQAFFRFNSNGFSVFNLIDGYRACFHACATSGAFVIINYYFHHLYPSLNRFSLRFRL